MYKHFYERILQPPTYLEAARSLADLLRLQDEPLEALAAMNADAERCIEFCDMYLDGSRQPTWAAILLAEIAVDSLALVVNDYPLLYVRAPRKYCSIIRCFICDYITRFFILRSLRYYIYSGHELDAFSQLVSDFEPTILGVARDRDL